MQQHILKEILSQVDCKFSESEIKGMLSIPFEIIIDTECAPIRVTYSRLIIIIRSSCISMYILYLYNSMQLLCHFTSSGKVNVNGLLILCYCSLYTTCVHGCNFYMSYAVAIKRCYENIRRTFLEQQSGKEDFVEQQSKRRKYRSRRERVRHA